MFYILFLLFLLVGYLVALNPKRYFILLIYLLSIYPLSASLSFLNLKSGVYVFDSVLLGILGFIFINKRMKIKKADLYLLLVGFIYILYLFYAVINSREMIYILKDIRPLIYLVTGWLFTKYFDDKSLKVDDRDVMFYFIISFIFVLIKLTLQNFLNASGNDEFYQDNTYRYLDATVYIASVYFIYLFSSKREINKNAFITIVFCLGIIAIANSRFIVISILLSIVILNYKNINRIIPIIFYSTVLLGVFYLYSVNSDAERVLRGFTEEGIAYQITSRFSPAINVIKEMTDLQIIFGQGLGKPFYIPWFEYRGDINPYNINIDSLYLTIFVKFGVLSVLIVGRLLVFYKVNFNDKGGSFIAIFLAMMFIVSATVYQIYAIGLIMGYLLVRANERSC